MNELTFVLAAMILAQAPDAAAAPPASAVQVQSVWDFMVKGGPLMIPIGLCSFVAVAVFVERLLTLRRNNVIPPNFLPGLKRHLTDGRRDREKALQYCRDSASPVGAVFAAGIRKLGAPVEVLEKHIQEAGEREIVKLRKYTRLLSVIASIAPLIGLLGTIFGMITAFQTVAASGEALGKTELLAKGIYEAMITTAGGLMVAIPTLIFHHWIAARIDQLVAEIDQMTVDFVEELAAPGAGASRTGATAAAPEPSRQTPAAAVPAPA